jgi:NAD(P)-dependent dehydrogenase (short-subunit alcohol dehydrogenase family)
MSSAQARTPIARTALITGASRGLGAALALALARRGTRVALVARDLAAVEAVAKTIRASGGEAHAIAGDLGEKASIHRIVGAATMLVGDLDLLINAASSLGPTPLPLLLDTACEDLERVLAVNLVGPFRLTKVVGGAMALRGRGTVVNISSDVAVEAHPRWGAYGASKAALDHLTRTFAAELADSGVRFLAIDPGEMDTQMHRDALPDADPSTLADPADVAEAIVARIADKAHFPSGSRSSIARAS